MVDDITIIIAFINAGQHNPLVAAYFPDNNNSNNNAGSNNV